MVCGRSVAWVVAVISYHDWEERMTIRMVHILTAVLSALGLVCLILLAAGTIGHTPVALAEDHGDGDTLAPVQTTDGTWGPGVVTATSVVTINSGVSITIAPNTTIRVADGGGIVVYGTLQSDGPVLITSASDPATPGAWQGITYADGSRGHLDATTIEYATHGLVLDTDNSIALRDCTLRYNRHAPAVGEDAFGAGIAIRRGNHTVDGCTVTNNELIATGGASAFGGGVDVQGPGSQITNSVIRDNVISSTTGFAVGGGVAIRGSGNAAHVSGCDLTGNTARAGGLDAVTTYAIGGGIGIPPDQVTDAVIQGNWIADNSVLAVVANGGGIGLSGGARADTIDGNVVYRNLAESPGGNDNYWAEGGGIDLWTQNLVTVTNNLILSNTVRCMTRCYANTGPMGGGMVVNGLSNDQPARVFNNTVVGNLAEGGVSGGYGGGFAAQTFGVFANNIVALNRATKAGGGYYWWAGVSTGYNALWNNSPNHYAGSPPASRPGDIITDPRFVNNGDKATQYHLLQDSPAIDAGTDSLAGLPTTDYDGDSRPLGKTRDIGFDEVRMLEIAKAVNRSTARSGDALMYTIAITNPDPYSALTAGGMVDGLPEALIYASGPTCSTGSCSYVPGSNSIAWNGSIAPTARVEVVYTATVGGGLPEGALITNTATLTAAARGITSAPATTTVYAMAFTVTKTIEGAAVAGAPLTYTLTVTNLSSVETATGVVVTDVLPAGAGYVSGGTLLPDDVVEWTIPVIAPGMSQEAGFVVTTCQATLENADYRVVTSTQGADSPPGPAVITDLTPPMLAPDIAVDAPDPTVVGSQVVFTATGHTTGGPIVAWTWDYGDGESGAGEWASHTYATAGIFPVTLTITDTCGYTAGVETAIEILGEVSAAVEGNGNVATEPDQTTYHYGDVLTLTATADPGWTFAGWSGDLSSPTNPATLTVTANHVVTATFTQDAYALTRDTVGNGNVATEPDQPAYHYGDVLTLTATADPGWTFAGWSGDLSGTTNPATLTVTANHVVTATFTRDEYALTRDTVGNGNVATEPDQTTYHYGDVLTLTATADPGWTFAGWSGDLSGTTNPATLTVTANHVVTATFTRDEYALTRDTVGNGNVATEPDQPAYRYGDVVTLTATADPGWTFAGWSGDLSGPTNPSTLTITANHVVTATFTQDAYPLVTGVVGSGTVTRQPDQPAYHYGDVLTLTATADPGWTFAGWSGDLSGATNPATLTVTANHVVTATFTQDAYPLVTGVVGSGTVTRQPDQPAYHYGDVLTLTATAAPGWTFAGWSGDLSGPTNPSTLTVTANHVVTATFTQDSYPLVTGVVGSGTVTRQPDQPAYRYGDAVTLTATAAPGWTFAGWSGNLSGTTNPATLIIRSRQAISATFLETGPAPTDRKLYLPVVTKN
jgi:uncharacterized repeat protein (TIGR01451 family)/uncharacterized repeat protein (TIGR02543 family)